MYSEIQKSNICDQIVNKIKELIIKGELKPGDKLPNERDLAEKFNVSRISVREALRSLRQMGFLDTQPGEGTFIKEINSSFLMNAFSSYLFFGNRPVIEVLEFRELLEVRAARCAAERGGIEDIELIKIYKNRVAAVRNGMTEEFLQADLAFHKSIARATKNSLFEKLLDAIRETLNVHQRWAMDEPGAFDRALYYHEEIYKSIRDKNPEDAAEMMRKHIVLLEEVVTKHIGNSDS
jgi:GntR family transcriptional repressor for pyruvate dehydrogenase complex